MDGSEEEGLYSEAFSKRDLSGEYDAASAVTVQMNGSTISCSGEGVAAEGSMVTISKAGTYILTGTLNGSIIVDVSKEDKVQLVLNGVTVKSDDFAAIYVRQADKVFVTMADGTVNSLANGGSFSQIDENEVNSVVFAKDDITFNGTGRLIISSPAGHGISGKDEVTITQGVYEISAADHGIRAKDSLSIADGTFSITSGNDGLHAENGDDDTLGSIYIAGGTYNIQASDDAVHAVAMLRVDGGTLDIKAAEGLEATYVLVNGGDISIAASDDGVNAAYKSSAYAPAVEINGGSLTIVMGAGDTDGIDSNGSITINGGTINITGQSAFDCDGSAQYNGGTLIVNGQQVNSIPNQMMGGRGGMMGGRGGMTGDLGGMTGGRGGMTGDLGGMTGGRGGMAGGRGGMTGDLGGMTGGRSGMKGSRGNMSGGSIEGDSSGQASTYGDDSWF
jgi:hypothetical protein